MIALINSFAGLQLSLKRRKLEREILTFFHVDQIIIPGEQSIECEETVNNKCESLKSDEIKHGLSLQTSERRYHKNRIIETLHVLIDVLTLYNCHFKTYITNGKNGAVKQETIRSVELPNGVVLNTEDIKDLGMKIYQVLFSKLKGHT